MSIFVLILAGGRGDRLGGVRKADLRISNISLLDHVTRRLGPLQTPPLISTGPGPTPTVTSGIALPDPDMPVAGPLAGIAAGALYLADKARPDDRLVTVAVDTPFLPQDYIARLVDGAGTGAACACWSGNPYPTNAIWPVPVLSGLLEAIAAGTVPKSPRALLAQCSGRMIDWADTAADDPFANLNTLADLIQLGRRAAAEGE